MKTEIPERPLAPGHLGAAARGDRLPLGRFAPEGQSLRSGPVPCEQSRLAHHGRASFARTDAKMAASLAARLPSIGIEREDAELHRVGQRRTNSVHCAPAASSSRRSIKCLRTSVGQCPAPMVRR
jgi:hypothetical protein